MRAKPTNPLYQYAFVACIGIALLLGQVFKLHMHIAHDANSAGSTSSQMLDVHIASTLHDTIPDSHHDDSHNNHHVAEVDISSDSFVKKINSLTLFLFFFLIVSTLLYRQQAVRISHPDFVDSGPTASLYHLHPPLRAPPR